MITPKLPTRENGGKALAAEDAVMEAMHAARARSKYEQAEAKMGVDPIKSMRAALLALARECDWRSQGSVNNE